MSFEQSIIAPRDELVALKKEKQKFAERLSNFNECEAELAFKISEFEEVFSVLTELKDNYDYDK